MNQDSNEKEQKSVERSPSDARSIRFQAALARTNEKYASALKKLAEFSREDSQSD